MDGEGDESFDDDWWDSLAIDPVTDTQLQELEQQAQASGSVTTPAPSSEGSLQTQLQELRALHAEQQKLIDTLTRQTQQQKGEISVVRANWSRVQEQNSGLQHQNAELEAEYRQRLERIQQENRRQMEKLETAAAFRDTSRTAWPSTLRRRPPVMLHEPNSSKRTPGQGILTTPTRTRIVHHTHSPTSSQTPVSPLSLTRRKRSLPADDEPVSPSRTRSAKVQQTQGKKAEFPRFVNSFLPPPPTGLTTPATRTQVKSPPSSQLAATRSSSPATPSPELRAVEVETSLPVPDATTYVLTVLFCYRTRWATHVMCQPYIPLPPPATLPGTAYFPLGPGLHPWSSALDPDAPVGRAGPGPPPMLLHLLSMQLPSCVPDVLRRRFSHAADTLWTCVTKGSSYSVFLAECGHVVDEVLRKAQGEHATRDAMDAAIERVWETQAASLYGTVAAALRVLTGLFLRLNWTHHVAAMLNWMTSLGVAHPGFVFFFLKKMQYLDWSAPDEEKKENGMVPSSQDDLDMLPSSQDTEVPSAPDVHLGTPTSLVKMLIESIRKSHIVPLSVASPASQVETEGQSVPVWDMGESARTALLVSVLRCAKVLAWNVGGTGVHELQPLFQEPGVLLTLLDGPACVPQILLHAVELLTLLVPDPLTLHIALASPYDKALQPRAPARLLQVRFPVVDILAKHLVDRRGDTSAVHIHRFHRAVLLFMSAAARHGDTAVIFSESVPLLPALIQCLSWDTEEVWSGPAGQERTERALERVCLSTRLLHQLYTPETSAGRSLAEKLLSTQAQAILNGIRHAFIVAMGRTAFAREPSWLSVHAPGGDSQERSRMRSQLENAAVLAGDLIDLVLSPSETDEIYELLAEDHMA